MDRTKAEVTGSGDVIETARRRLRALLATFHGQDATRPASVASGQSIRDMPGEILREVFAKDLADLSMRQVPLHRRPRAPALLH